MEKYYGTSTLVLHLILEIECFTYKVCPLITAVLPLAISEWARFSKCPSGTAGVGLGL